MTDDDELDLARATGRARGDAAPPISAAQRNYLMPMWAEPMRTVARLHDERESNAEVPRSPTRQRRTGRRRS